MSAFLGKLKRVARPIRDNLFNRMQSLRSRVSGITNGFPPPSAELTFLVSGHRNVYLSLKNGRIAAESIRNTLKSNGIAFDDLERVLDFGCGSGRVIRQFKCAPGRIHGSDYNPELIRYCRETFRFAEFRKNELSPPTSWNDKQFDLIYMLSVFTHLDEACQFEWLAEFRRILKPGGHLLFSTHGAKFLDNCPSITSHDRQAFLNGQFILVQKEVEGTNSCGAYHPHRYVKSTLAKGWDIVDFVQNGALGNGGQDYWLFKKPVSNDNSMA